MKIILIGDGGHSRVIRDIILAKADEVYAVLDDKYTRGTEKAGKYYGPVAHLHKIMNEDSKVVIAIGNNLIRKRIMERLDIHLEQYSTLIHPTAFVSSTAEIGRGTVIMPFAVVNASARVGNHCIINSSAIVEHDNIIGDFCHICPNVTLTGDVLLGEGVEMGAASAVIPGKSIGSWSIVGAGSTVIRNVSAHSKVAGSPAKSIRKSMPIKFLQRSGGDSYEKLKNFSLPATHDRK
ncbi:acetyltransferase [Halobacillus sp. A1]|uniref:acetyltransferase n=1 Tax=Halobacillus sp. A1 TaxID=2880262 RepID=UPI0020A6C732|nr:acetyltransferase [Halobacillus sp. A1]MCP3030048.1 acetyltransferase [Halobacillus sp. A1]